MLMMLWAGIKVWLLINVYFAILYCAINASRPVDE